MLKHWGQELSKGFCSGQMLPLITAEKKRLRISWMLMEANQISLREIFKDFPRIFLVVHMDWKRFGGVIICHCLNLRVKVKFKGVNVAFFLSQEHLHLYAGNFSFLINKLGTVIQETMSAAPQHCGFNAISVSIKSSIMCLWLPKFNNSVQM